MRGRVHNVKCIGGLVVVLVATEIIMRMIIIGVSYHKASLMVGILFGKRALSIFL